MRTAFLSSVERERGARAYRLHATFNGMGFTFLADTTVALMAVNLGASNTQLGFIASAVQLSGLILPFVPVLFGGMNVGQVYAKAWLWRGLVCMLYFGIPFVRADRGMALLLVTYTAFCLTRVFGAAMAPPVQRALSTRATLGTLIAGLSVRSNIFVLVARVVSAAVLRIPALAGMAGLLVLEFFGIVTNTISAVYLERLGVRDTVERSSGFAVIGAFQEHVRQPGRLRVLVLSWLALVTGIMFSFTVPFLKRAAGFSASEVFVYTIAGGVAGILGAVIVQPFADRMGGGPLLFVCNTATAAMAVVWALVRPSAGLWFFLTLGFATALVMTVAGLLVNRLVVRSIPDRDKVGYTSMYSFVNALVALGAGLAGGALLDAGAGISTGPFHAYSLAYLAAAGLSLIGAVGALRVKEDNGQGLRETVGILFSLRNLRDFLDLYQLDTTQDPVRREAILAAIEQSDTTLATAEIGSRLKSPLTADRERALKSLFTHPRPELLDEILAEACDRHSHIRATAIFALGAYPGPEVEAQLVRMLDEESVEIQSTAAKSLARIGHTASLARIRSAASRPGLPTIARINYAIALTLMDSAGEHLRGIFDNAPPDIGYRSEQSILSTYARFLELSPPLSEFFHQENTDPGSGVTALLEEARELAPFMAFAPRARELFDRGDYDGIWTWCREQLATHAGKIHGPASHMAEAIRTWDTARTDATNTIAALYFTYQILRAPVGRL